MTFSKTLHTVRFYLEAILKKKNTVIENRLIIAEGWGWEGVTIKK